jgi:hypothetical protein
MGGVVAGPDTGFNVTGTVTTELRATVLNSLETGGGGRGGGLYTKGRAGMDEPIRNRTTGKCQLISGFCFRRRERKAVREGRILGSLFQNAPSAALHTLTPSSTVQVLSCAQHMPFWQLT